VCAHVTYGVKMADMPVSCFMQGHQEYIQKKVNPVLESMVTQVLLERPDDLVPYMIKWLSEQADIPSSTHSAEYQELQEDIRRGEARVEELRKKVGKLPEKGAKALAQRGEIVDEEEDESEGEESEGEDLPPPPKNYKSKGPRSSVSAEAYGAWNQMQPFTPPVFDKTAEQANRILQKLEESFLFAALDQNELQVVVSAMQEKQVEAGTEIIHEGDDGDALYVIDQGELECSKMIEGEDKVVKVCGPGDAFGELALLYSCPRAASVRARSACFLWQLDRETFNHIVKDASQKKRDKYESFLKSVPLLEGMENDERSKVADALRTEKFESGAFIVKQLDPGDKFFIIEEGEAIATKSFDTNQIPLEVMAYKPGDYFGELALLHNEPRAANVVAKGPVRVLALDRRSFKRLLGPLEDILRRNATTYANPNT